MAESFRTIRTFWQNWRTFGSEILIYGGPPTEDERGSRNRNLVWNAKINSA